MEAPGNGHNYEYVSTTFQLIISMRWIISMIPLLLGINMWSLTSLTQQKMEFIKCMIKWIYYMNDINGDQNTWLILKLKSQRNGEYKELAKRQTSIISKIKEWGNMHGILCKHSNSALHRDQKLQSYPPRLLHINILL